MAESVSNDPAEPLAPVADPLDSREQILAVDGLSTYFFTREGVVKAVDNLTFDLKKGETLGIVGESGCGKSMTALSVMRLVPDPPGRIVDGTVVLDNRDLLTLSEAEMRDVRGNEISMIFQEPMTSLNPVITIGHQISEALILHQGMSKTEAMEKSIEMLALVGESGSGKSVTALSVMQLLPYPLARHPSGSIVFKGRELIGAPRDHLREVRGNEISMIFQEPMTSLNPLHTVEKQINETLILHKGLDRAAARTRAL
ncbi:MAG: ATP-binding cassette domain-containing protein, partial [Alphaproteobacteria bacterium]|nr:ATP-binding cassette domain-containing protein [Alphaproteobacteria bacterium]